VRSKKEIEEMKVGLELEKGRGKGEVKMEEGEVDRRKGRVWSGVEWSERMGRRTGRYRRGEAIYVLCLHRGPNVVVFAYIFAAVGAPESSHLCNRKRTGTCVEPVCP
jgi:hypothetical protein